MNKHYIVLSILFLFTVFNLQAQEEGNIKIEFPDGQKWNEISEGTTLEFKLNASGGLSGNYKFSANSETSLNFQLNEDGFFRWQPAYDLVTPEERRKTYPILFEVTNEGGQVTTRQVEFVVKNQARITSFFNIEPFYVNPDQSNTYELSVNGSDYSFSLIESTAPEGMEINNDGIFSWTPTSEQFTSLQKNPLTVEFMLEDKQYGDKIPGKLEVAASPEAAQPVAQTPELKLVLPKGKSWNVVSEGNTLTFQLSASGGKDKQYTFNMIQGSSEDVGIIFDEQGNFYWTPSFDLVDRLEETKTFQVIFEVNNSSGESDRQQVNLLVYHTNRAPEIADLKTFYVQYNVQNVYQLGTANAITDPDNDPLVFKPILAQMPQGMTLSGQGELSWKPSYGQYTRLQKEPMELEYIVEDQPYKAQTKGKIRIAVTQQDHPPEISMVPNEDAFSIREDEALNLKFYLSDPNGDQDIASFDFVSETNRIPKSSLIKNDMTQWEFIWSPGYDFFLEPGMKDTYEITFFVVDQTNQRAQRSVSVTVEDAENLEEKDRLLYNQYRTSLVRIWNLMEQLKEKQKELQKEYKKAKKTKKHRAVTTASLGAITGLSPVVLSDNQDTQKYVSGVGGTTSMTLGSLEASNVIGQDPSGVFEKLSYITQKLNALETQGNVFAGKYALSNTRRQGSFNEDLKKIIEMISLKDVTTLELDPTWENPKNPSDKNIQDTFKDFNPDPEKSSIINE
ncbi:hypothetical protein OKW21_001112 [Catalinimonas alkaloidigena]|uniref:hypothetical protein n=1 Tax=Catalinimonas alkaloidigena TaxID=1075417 RepID=UPI002404D0A7|nr:hypothetical protein [Catalinimonas alkaloidigena]MDF9795849.1 hypothetical protein [Catalinimonas alkaloidigena]